MADYIVTCTSTCDLGKEYLSENDIPYACFKMIVGNDEYYDDFFSDYPYEKFYEDIKGGMEPTTSQVGYGQYLEFFEPLIEKSDVIHICLSSGISGDYQTCHAVAEELNGKGGHRIKVIDSRGASAGYGMLVMLAKENLDKGMSFDENAAYLEDIKLKIHHWFISTDLSSYVRGGRISKTAGFFGSALKICPLMNMPADGTLNPLEKIRTKTRAMDAMLEKMEEYADGGLDYDGKVMMSVSMCEEDAQILKERILERFTKVKDVGIYRVGTTIGAHTGPGTIALYFIGKERG